MMNSDSEKTHQMNIKACDIPAKLVDDLKMLRGLPPYDDSSNLCLNDSYFSASIDREFGEDMVEAAEILIIEPMEQEYEQLKIQLGKKYTPEGMCICLLIIILYISVHALTRRKCVEM